MVERNKEWWMPMSEGEASINVDDIEKENYIGDGVYASFDGFQVWVRASENRVALEPAVFVELLRFAKNHYNFLA